MTSNVEEIPVDPIQAARNCLRTGEIVLLRVRQFKDDLEAHDDDLQERLAEQFDDAFVSAIESLESEFGPASEIDCDLEDVPLPLCGFFRVAIWEIDK
nr:putative integron gene cassette protein [uncultured bacterium]